MTGGIKRKQPPFGQLFSERGGTDVKEKSCLKGNSFKIRRVSTMEAPPGFVKSERKRATE